MDNRFSALFSDLPDTAKEGTRHAPDLYSDLGGKQLELLKEASSKVSRVVVLWDPANPGNTTWLGGMKVAAGTVFTDASVESSLPEH
jgi:hypothetical protein